MFFEELFKFQLALKKNQNYNIDEVYDLIRQYGNIKCFRLVQYFEKESFRCVNRLYCKRARIRKRLISMKKPYFLTLTINDDFIKVISKKTFKRYVKDTLSVFESYIANVDFGSKNGRLHFHAVVDNLYDIKKEDIKWKYGFIDFKIICDIRNVNKYLYKLCNHAIKKTASDLMYSRKKSVK